LCVPVAAAASALQPGWCCTYLSCGTCTPASVLGNFLQAVKHPGWDATAACMCSVAACTPPGYRTCVHACRMCDAVMRLPLSCACTSYVCCCYAPAAVMCLLVTCVLLSLLATACEEVQLLCGTHFALVISHQPASSTKKTEVQTPVRTAEQSGSTLDGAQTAASSCNTPSTEACVRPPLWSCGCIKLCQSQRV
jgi:hypothetical protein